MHWNIKRNHQQQILYVKHQIHTKYYLRELSCQYY